MKVFSSDTIILLLGCLLVSFMLYATGAKAGSVKCLSNEPREYYLDVQDQIKGEYFQIIEFESGPKAGMVYVIRIKDISLPSESDDYIKKSCVDCTIKNKIVYSLSCSKPMK